MNCLDCGTSIDARSKRCRRCCGRINGKINPGRKPFGERALTGAEKMMRYRARLKGELFIELGVWPFPNVIQPVEKNGAVSKGG